MPTPYPTRRRLCCDTLGLAIMVASERQQSHLASVTNAQLLKDWIRHLLSQTCQRIPPPELIRTLRNQFPGVNSLQIRHVIQEMVESQELLYTHHFSISHLEWNHLRPLHVSPRIVLSGGAGGFLQDTNEIVIRLKGGGAFGSGDHPTTRLSLAAIDAARDLTGDMWGRLGGAALDVGTGTGVLAIASVLLGMPRALGVDLDPLSCREACANVRLNGLQERIQIIAGSMGVVRPGKFELLMANLRPPTLCAMMPTFETVSRQGAIWVLSGFRTGEAESLKLRLPPGYGCVYAKTSLDWGAMVIKSAIGP
ncbi:MAG: 50S ribosomal protein L11 methyltransferase [Desulfatitalea sp.]|nr:50S ribosomal protein L11 methyltransferase [Desulfatitalea sp.]